MADDALLSLLNKAIAAGTLKNAPVQLSSGGWLSSKESYGDCDVEANVLWEKVFSGCEFRVAVKDDANYIAVAINAPRRPRGAAAPTGPQRYSVSVNNMVNGCRLALGTLTTDLAFDEGAWHDVSVGVKDGEISCTIDGGKADNSTCLGSSAWIYQM